jgi:hypothetical protein
VAKQTMYTRFHHDVLNDPDVWRLVGMHGLEAYVLFEALIHNADRDGRTSAHPRDVAQLCKHLEVSEDKIEAILLDLGEFPHVQHYEDQEGVRALQFDNWNKYQGIQRGSKLWGRLPKSRFADPADCTPVGHRAELRVADFPF